MMWKEYAILSARHAVSHRGHLEMCFITIQQRNNYRRCCLCCSRRFRASTTRARLASSAACACVILSGFLFVLATPSVTFVTDSSNAFSTGLVVSKATFDLPL